MNVSASRHLFEDFDAFREHIAGWETEPIQLSSGALQINWEQLDFPDLRLSHLRANQLIADRSAVDPGWLVFVVCFGHKTFCGIRVVPGSLVTLGPGREYRNLLQKGWESFEISLDRRLLQERLPGGSEWPLKPLAPELSVTTLPVSLATRFRMLSRQLLSVTTSNGILGDVPWAAALREQALSLLSEALMATRSVGSDDLPKQLHGASLVERALFVLDTSPDLVNVSSGRLAQELGCGRRTLEQAFRNVLHCSPYQYLMARRLNNARRELLMPFGNTTVTAAATAQGFEHLARFSAGYCRLFGELPSVTLARAKAMKP
jgi:AraC family transcriptional regulator, ethanolamine operon transcriptional activator